eukprot:CAMPEP_0172500936 /NCGR_PEP_ID=MMETSP1066-20121228/144275_1 /TAXON_ID=671091 /ORGANISM="Coscinodiscus wailesii, Strain CCMP2513" /LENGTH=400 /DNA_ID=CAMNT_0013275439 /DNA_START=242 /DNA_END=1444 /DNA_ORIENTATION=-
MPFMSGVVGWFTNVLALQMTFYPLEYRGISLFRFKNQPWGFFGWQGIIPTKAEKMARKTVKLMTTKLFNIKEIFARLDPDTFGSVMEQGVLLLMDSIINEVMELYMPNVWRGLPQKVRDEVVLVADMECPKFLAAFMADMQAHTEEILDIEEMTVKACVENKKLLNLMFQECGEQEFAFIRRSGLYLGFLFGVFQMGIWFCYTEPWLLPVCGFIVGWLTNYIALKIIFRPLNKRKVCCFELQGLFLKRQNDVAETFARINCVELLHTRAMWESILTGRLRGNFTAMLRAHTLLFTNNLLGGMKPIINAAMGAEKFGEMKETIAQKVVEKLPTVIDQSYAYTTEALGMEETIKTRMQNLTSAEFEAVLHPAFEEDEITLIIVGGILGMVVGFLQILLMFLD